MSENIKLKKINKEIKTCINEANFVSIKFRNKIIKMLADEFSVSLPLENYANIDIVLEEDGSIIMRGDKYETNNKVKNIEELEEKFNNFKTKANNLINKKDFSYGGNKDFNNISNLFIIGLILLVFLILILFVIRSLLIGDYYNCLWLIIMSSIWIVPGLKNNLKNRTEQAKNYLKRKFKKRK